MNKKRTNVLKSCEEKSVGTTEINPKFLVNKTGVPEHKAPPRIRSLPCTKSIISSFSCSDVPIKMVSC